MNRGIGEEIEDHRSGDHLGKVLGRFEVGTTPMDIICSRMRAMLLAFGVVAVVIFIMFLPIGFASPIMLLVLLIIALIAFVFTFILVIGILFALLYPLGDRVLKENWSKVCRKGILIQHKLWITTGPMRNFIPFGNILKVDLIGDDFMEKRRKRTKLWYKVMVLHPEPPPGGLYHYYSNPKGLVVIHLIEPTTIHNLGYFGKFTWWPMATDKSVSEVILDVDPEHHEDLRSIRDHLHDRKRSEIDK